MIKKNSWLTSGQKTEVNYNKKINFGFILTPKSGLILRHKRGFTLIELMVVIGIIGILSTLITVSLSDAKAKARDAKRMNDTKVIATALEIYYQDHGYYPPYDDYNTQGDESSDPNLDGPDNEFIKPLREQGYISRTPLDPINNLMTYSYRYWTYICVNGSKTNHSDNPQHYVLLWYYENHNNTCGNYINDYCNGSTVVTASQEMGCSYK